MLSKHAACVFGRAFLRPSTVKSVSTNWLSFGSVTGSIRFASSVPQSSAGESVDDIKKDLISLFDTEAAERQEEIQAYPPWQAAKNWLKDSQFKLVEAEGSVTLSKKVGQHSVTVSFDTIQEPDENGLDEEEGQDEAAEPDQDEEGDDMEPEDFPKEVPLEVRIAVSDKQGKPRGELVVHGFAGEDSRLFAQAIEVPQARKAAAESQDGGPEGPEVQLEALQTGTQDRFYDFLDSLGIDDQLSHYIKQHVWQAKASVALDAIRGIKSVLGK